MSPENGINLNIVNYFPLEEYVNKIHLSDYLLSHMEETNKNFDTFFKQLKE